MTGYERKDRTPGFSQRFVDGWVSLRDVMADAERRLAAAGVESPRTDAAILVSHVIKVPRTHMLLQDEITSDQRTQFEILLSRRMARVPLQHLLGIASFRHIDVAVGPGVFVPRPETELVAEAGIAALMEYPESERLGVELCAGTAAMAISMATEVSAVSMFAVEVDPAALEWTERNVTIHQPALADRGSSVQVVAADARRCAAQGGVLADIAGRAAVVVVNPPYIPEDAQPREPEVRDHEPRLALYGGDDGLDVIRGVLGTASQLLREGGLVAIEHGDRQGEAAGALGVPALLREGDTAACWRDVHDHLDLTRRARFTTARRTGHPA
ncbi:MAG: HemK/PrmC family methyltransferase [Candidatus Nanopelagicales bacterium]